MKILAINGSPRRERGSTERVLDAISEAAERRDTSTVVETMYLADETPRHCTHCGHPCFSDGTCIREDGATIRSERIRNADALILGVPVYCWQPNALSCALFDKFRIPRGTWLESSAPGIPAVGVAVAGGTGTGVFPALQSIYSWFCAWRFTPVEPVPVTRYNIEETIGMADRIATSLESATGDAPFSERWDQMLCYDELPFFMRYGRIDEFEWLTRSMIQYLAAEDPENAALREVAELLSKIDNAPERGDSTARAKAVMNAFSFLFPLCR